MPEPGTYGPLSERVRRPPRRTLRPPIVTELVPVLEPVGRDPFIDGPEECDRCQSWRPRSGRRPTHPIA